MSGQRGLSQAQLQGWWASAHSPAFCSAEVHILLFTCCRFSVTGTYVQTIRGTVLSLATPHSPRSQWTQQWLGKGCVCLESQHWQIQGAPGEGCSLCVDLRPPRIPERLLVPGTNLATSPWLVKTWWSRKNSCSLHKGKSQKLSKHWHKPLRTERERGSERETDCYFLVRPPQWGGRLRSGPILSPGGWNEPRPECNRDQVSGAVQLQTGPLDVLVSQWTLRGSYKLHPSSQKVINYRGAVLECNILKNK